jgi:hypothetical protein
MLFVFCQILKKQNDKSVKKVVGEKSFNFIESTIEFQSREHENTTLFKTEQKTFKASLKLKSFLLKKLHLGQIL